MTAREQSDRIVSIGTAGERAVLDYLETEFPGQVVDVRKDPQYQKLDVDFLTPNGTVEVKTDTFLTGNMALEIWASDRPGCFPLSTADWWAYLVAKTGTLYLFKRAALAADLYLGLAEGRYRLKPSKTVPGFHRPRQAIFTIALAPLDEVAARVPCLKVTLDPLSIS